MRPALATLAADSRIPARVLVVEDHSLLRRSLGRWLERAGHEVATAGSAAEARSWVREGDFDVFVVDVSLPDGSGLDLLSRLRAKCPDVPVVLITGDVSPKTPLDALRGGAFAFLEKPLDLVKLAAILTDAVRHHRARKQARDEAERVLGRVYAGERRTLRAAPTQAPGPRGGGCYRSAA